MVRDLKGEGVTICATIHSPSPYTFDLFDRLLVLVRGEAVRPHSLDFALGSSGWWCSCVARQPV